jgi:integrase
MATVSKHGKGWRVQIRRAGHPPLSKTFPLKTQAWAWAAQVEREIVEGSYNPIQHTLDEALERYELKEAPKREGHRWEVLRIRAFRRHRIARRPISRITEADLASWRDERLESVSGSTVRREMNLWEQVFEVARKEWKWIERNPIRDVKKPSEPPSRRRGVTEDEVRQMGEKLTGPYGREVFLGFRLGIETAMRAGEMWSLTRDQLDMKTSVAHLLKTKNGDTREVPLSPEAMKILRELLADGRQELFLVSKESRDALFRKARNKTPIPNLHFHDSRSEGISRLSKKMDVLELARVVGHRDIRSLMFYYRADAAAIARRLARNTPEYPEHTSADASPPPDEA